MIEYSESVYPVKLGHLMPTMYWKYACHSAIANQHKKDKTVIGVDLWEGAHEDDTAKRYDSYLPKVSKFVKGLGDKMDYNVVMDNNDQFMGKTG